MKKLWLKFNKSFIDFKIKKFKAFYWCKNLVKTR